LFLGTPLEEPFRVIVWLFIGLPLAGFIIWLALNLFAIKLAFLALMLAVVISMVGYVIGIPWTFYRFLKGDT